MGRFWLFFGIALVCSGVGLVFGVILIIFYFWEEYKKSTYTAVPNQQKLEKVYDDEVLDEMK